MKRPTFAPPAPLSVDFLRSQLLENNPDLIAIVLGRTPVYVFDGRQRCALEAHCSLKDPCTFHRLERLQMKFEEDFGLYQQTHNADRVRELARDLPRTARHLRRAATGWRDRAGVVHRYALDNPELTKDVMRAELAEGECAV